MNKCLNIIIVADSEGKGALTCQSRKFALAISHACCVSCVAIFSAVEFGCRV